MVSMSAAGMLAGAVITALLLLQGDSDAMECAAADVADPQHRIATGLMGASGFGGGSSYLLCDFASETRDDLPAQNTGRRQKMVSDAELSRRWERFGF